MRGVLLRMTMGVLLVAATPACFAPAFDVRGKLCTESCPAPYVCGLTDGGGPPACTDAYPRTQACLEDPAACGFPDGTNVGTPRGTVLSIVPDALRSGTGWSWSDDEQSVLVTGSGATLTALEVHGAVDVRAPSVTLRNCRVLGSGGDYAVSFERAALQGELVDSSVGGASGHPVGNGVQVLAGNPSVTLRRVEISNAAVGLQADGVDVEDSYVHDLTPVSGFSASGTVSPGHGGTTIRHSTVRMEIEGNCALCLFTDTGATANDTFAGNLIDGGGYSVYGGGDGTSGISITDNRVGTGATYGPFAHVDASGAGNIFSGNVNDADSSAIK